MYTMALSIDVRYLLCCEHIITAWASEGGGREPWPPLDFEIISKKRLFFHFEGQKTSFTTFGPHLEKILPTPMHNGIQHHKIPAV